MQTFEKLSVIFSRRVREELGYENLIDAIYENLEDTDGSCATHGYTDTNMIMGDSIKELRGSSDDLVLDADTTELWNSAWELSMGQGFLEGLDTDEMDDLYGVWMTINDFPESSTSDEMSSKLVGTKHVAFLELWEEQNRKAGNESR